jgi:crotonobetainyl-CoA:carnitine CoA-transferase CaiB-like acyl-CoA transferase
MTKVMEGIRVLEVAEHTFVPAAAAVLSDWGADVIKIEHVERGDAMRGLASTGVMELGGRVHALLEHSNRGKRSLALDLSQPEGLDVLYRLAKTADVFLTNKLPHIRTRLKIDTDDIRAQNPNIIYVAGSGYGPKGPDARRGGYDVLGYWCRSGLAIGGTPLEIDHIVTQPAPAYGDSIGAMTIAGGISAALLHRERTGKATTVDVSLMGVGMWAAGAAIALGQQTGQAWRPPPAVRQVIRNPLACAYRTKDQRWLFLSCLEGFKYWPDACRVIGRPELVHDERFNNHTALTENAFDAMKILESVFGAATLDEWRVRLDDFTGQWAVVQDTLEVVNDPQAIANAYIVEAETKEGVRFPLVATPVQFDGESAQTRRAPEFNEQGDEILVEAAGLDWDSIVQLKMKGVVA